jgi:hypothetical protein
LIEVVHFFFFLMQVPSPRAYHTVVRYDGHKIILFGGFDGVNYLNDLYELDVTNGTWIARKTTGPFFGFLFLLKD